MTTTALHLSFPPPSFHSPARSVCSHRQLLSQSDLTFPTLHISKSLPLPRLRRPSPIAMSSDSSPSSFPANQPPPKELNNESKLETIVSPDSYISICGFESLLSGAYNLPHCRRRFDEFGVCWRSARCTFPELINFRESRLNDFRRVYTHMAPTFFECGIAKPETKIPVFIKREPEFRFLAVVLGSLDGKPYNNRAVLCARYSDEEFFRVRCNGSKETYFELFGRYNIDKIWRDDILPCRTSLRHCVLAAENLSEVAYNNFLDHTFLGDRKTTIREYFATTGSVIMEEEPPESLKTMYLQSLV